MKRKSNTMNRFNAQTFVAVAAVTLGMMTHTVFGQAPSSVGEAVSQPTANLQNSSAYQSGGTTRSSGIDPKAQATQFVQLGREALKAGNAQQAMHWANQAKTLNATFTPTEDSPEKLLMDIQSSAGLQAAPIAPAVGATAVNMNQANPKAVGKRNLLIINARQALASGDVARATKLANDAGAMGIPYNVNDDTHENVLKHIQNFTDTLRQRQAQGETEAVRRLMAKSLIEQAQTLLGWGKLDEAASLTYAAQELKVSYNQYEVQPKDLLARIENARNQRNGRQNPTATAPATAIASAPAQNNAALEQARALTAQARLQMNSGNTVQAMSLASQAASLNVPETAFAQGEDRPSLVLRDLEMSGVAKDSNVMQVAGTQSGLNAGMAQNAAYNSATDTTQNIPVAAQTPVPSTIGHTLLQQAQAALQQGNREQARQIVLQAEQYRAELDPASAQRLTDMQNMLNNAGALNPAAIPGAIPGAAPAGIPGAAPAMSADATALFGQMVTEFENVRQKSSTVRQEDPQAALDMLKEFQKKVEDSALADNQKEMLLRNVKTKVVELEGYISENRAGIELQASNNKSKEALETRFEQSRDKEAKIKEMVDEFNTLIEEKRFAEAEVIGKRAQELYPEEVITGQLAYMGKMLNRQHLNNKIRSEKEDGYVKEMLSIDEASIPQTETLTYGENWKDINERRLKYRKKETRYSEKELEIIEKMKTPVQARYTNQPLQSVMEELAQMAGVTIHLAPDGLAEQSVLPSQPVTLNTQDTIPLKSALKLILEPLNLDYTVRNDVLMITSKSKKDTDVYTVTYPVADLVIPIPNFQPSSNMGLEGALRSAMGTANNGMSPWVSAMGSSMSQMPVVSAQNVNNTPDAAVAPGGMGQVSVPMGGSGAGSAMVGGGAGGGFGSPVAGNGGGASQEDFEKLIDLITTTVSPETWEANSGTGTISSFNVNLSLVVSQTQEVHEQIANLLEQLRRLQDLQITIECRFISLSDSFYERIGVDFNINIKANNADVFTSSGNVTNSTVTGRNDVTGTGEFAPAAQDIAIRQGSSSIALPMYGDFDSSANAGATLGFAILSDVEAYLFMEAAQSTERSNVLQAPKVTLFNGQQALVQDVTDTPFVVSVIPVVGDFAAALQPVIVVLSEGSFMTVQAVASPDRRYVRLTVVPFFSQIGDVTEFTFTGTTSTSRDTSGSGEKDDEKVTSSSGSTSGTTVQLPEYSYVTVTTTVSVPDGGTILLGGIKRLSEGRNEKGVPILNKIPFINRLFKNTGIGRETTSLMMMVTPRIIIQEEEEEHLGVSSKP
ncbi:MAG: general secretion pathway protein GspD [Planctomycetia bacterium]|nr:general secretion pathway protein GspD [Planctomycetia bacterium]